MLSKYFQIDATIQESIPQANRFAASLTNILPDLIGLFLFFTVSYGAFFIFETIHSPRVQLTFMAILITLSVVRSISIFSKILFSPAIPAFRILPIDCQLAGNIHKVIVITAGYIIGVLMFAIVANRLGAERSTVLLLQLFFATILLAASGIGVLISKNKVRDHIINSGEDEQGNTTWGRKQLGSIWHILAICYLLLIWVLLVSDISNPEVSTKGAFLLSFFIVPLWMLLDRLIQWIVLYAVTTLRIHQTHYEDSGEINEEIILQRQKGRKLYQKAKTLARACVAFALAIWIASLWNIEILFLSKLSGVLFDTLIILTLALVFWRFISSWIERLIQDSIPEQKEEEGDDEWGGAADRGRSYTLLPMIRKFVASVLVIMVTMTILSSFGVDIGPLLAGAGVIGLAIGFGAQKLVSDMFSGFFYLLDDAFRVGEYLTAGSVSGTVESITLRNVMLRHHRGMLQIVPHSDLGAITNYMRGGMVVKFNLDFPYDADIDKIRKIIKKVGVAMLADEEIGKDFLKPLKSQGVREITNSVMTIRVKFTAKPGTHFVIRREAFKRITESLASNGIPYAHKRVIVEVPTITQQQTTEPQSEEQKKIIANAAAAGAAALAAIQDDETKA